MKKPTCFQPSFYAHILNGILLFVVIFIIIFNSSILRRLDFYRVLILLLLITVAIGIHGISHMGLEIFYGYHYPFFKPNK